MTRVRTHPRFAATGVVVVAAVLLGGSPSRAYEPIPVLPATEISLAVTLKEAAQKGVVELKAKGGFATDAVAVDLKGKPELFARKPVTIEIRVEFISEGPIDVTSVRKLDDQMNKIERRLSGMRASSGRPVDVKIDQLLRPPGSSPTPGFHQVVMGDSRVTRSFTEGANLPNTTKILTGAWSPTESLDGLAHETMHLAGLKDQYDDYVVTTRGKYKLPWTAVPDADVVKWLKKNGLPTDHWKVVGEPRKGHETDLMGDTDCLNCMPSQHDIDYLAGQAGLHLTVLTGDVLVSKTPLGPPHQQNLVTVGGTSSPSSSSTPRLLQLFAPRSGQAHADGIWAFCLDHGSKVPARGVGYDVLGSVAKLRGPGLRQLEAVLAELQRRWSRSVPITRTRSEPATPDIAQSAIWSVTDRESFRASAADPRVMEILTAAHVSRTDAWHTPHFGDPAVAESATSAVTQLSILKKPATSQLSPKRTRLISAILGSRNLPSGKPVRLALRLRLEGRTPAKTHVAIEADRELRGYWRARYRLHDIAVRPGVSWIHFTLPAQPKGSYRLTLRGPFGMRTVPFLVDCSVEIETDAGTKCS